MAAVAAGTASPSGTSRARGTSGAGSAAGAGRPTGAAVTAGATARLPEEVLSSVGTVATCTTVTAGAACTALTG